MTRDEAQAVLFRLAAAYPRAQPPQPGTLEEWVIAASDVLGSTAMAAVDRWVAEQDWPPSINEFLDTCNRIALDRQRAPSEQAHTLAELPPGEQRSPMRLLIAASKVALDAFPPEKRQHYRCRKGECQACAAAPEIEAAVRAAVTAALADAGFEAIDDSSLEGLCSECGPDGGDGWILDAGSFLRPCRLCSPELWELWREGHFAPGHECSRCKPSRKRRPALTRESREATQQGQFATHADFATRER